MVCLVSLWRLGMQLTGQARALPSIRKAGNVFQVHEETLMLKLPVSQLKKELSWVLAVKITLLIVLWAVFFRHDGTKQQTDVAAVIFAGSEQGRAIAIQKPMEEINNVR
jgi:hypothetical protein